MLGVRSPADCNFDFCVQSSTCGAILELSNMFHNISYANSGSGGN
jgi:hypothetical protein